MRKYFLLGTQRIMERIEPPTVTVTFDDNLANYYMEGETWGTVESVPSAVVMAGQVLSSDVVPEQVTASYTLDSQTYVAFNTNDMWYRDSACTQKFKFGVDVITEDTTLYRKWGCNSKTINKSDAAGSLTFTLPKFVDTISGYCIGGGGASGAKSGINAESFNAEVSIVGCGTNGTAKSFSATAVTGGVPVTLYAGAGGSSSGAGTASYVNINGTRKITGAGGAAGGTVGNYNLGESSPEKYIISRTPIWDALYTYGYSQTNIVDGHSRTGRVSFQYIKEGRVSGSRYGIILKVMLDGSIKWNRRVSYVNYKGGDDDEYSLGASYGDSVSNYHFGLTPSSYGQGGYGGFCLSINSDSVSVSSQAGYRGRTYVTVSGG